MTTEERRMRGRSEVLDNSFRVQLNPRLFG